MRLQRTLCVLSLALLFACGKAPSLANIADEPPPAAASDAGHTCQPCTLSTECGAGSCAQYAGNDFCAKPCTFPTDCARSEVCYQLTTLEGASVNGCVPAGGTCGTNPGCGACDAGRCDLVAGLCNEEDAGTGLDAGPGVDAGAFDGTVTADGGTVGRLYFAVVGDTRPAVTDDTGHYPTEIINSIYSEIEGLRPRPQFVVSTGDFINADPYFSQARKQLALYTAAMSRYAGPVFASMGNHECTSLSSVNCSGGLFNQTPSYKAFFEAMVKPLGKAQPYYSIPVGALDGSWTSKVLILACNYWNTEQRTWLEQELQKPTTYTVVVRHQNSGGPCGGDVDKLLEKYPYTLLLVGHIHTFSHTGKQVMVGTGGAPILTGVPHGFATVEQLAQGGLKVTQYDSSTGLPVTSFTLP